jgi:hypothetical protein
MLCLAPGYSPRFANLIDSFGRLDYRNATLVIVYGSAHPPGRFSAPGFFMRA